MSNSLPADGMKAKAKLRQLFPPLQGHASLEAADFFFPYINSSLLKKKNLKWPRAGKLISFHLDKRIAAGFPHTARGHRCVYRESYLFFLLRTAFFFLCLLVECWARSFFLTSVLLSGRYLSIRVCWNREGGHTCRQQNARLSRPVADRLFEVKRDVPYAGTVTGANLA